MAGSAGSLRSVGAGAAEPTITWACTIRRQCGVSRRESRRWGGGHCPIAAQPMSMAGAWFRAPPAEVQSSVGVSVPVSLWTMMKQQLQVSA
jgi:hypothetical protein